MRKKDFKLGIAIVEVLLIILIVGCTTTDLTYDEVNHDTHEGENQYGRLEHTVLVEVEEIVHEDGRVMARLIRLVEQDMSRFTLETPSYIVLEGEYEELEVKWVHGFVSLVSDVSELYRILWLEGDGLVQIEEGTRPTISDAAITDIDVGDILRLYLRQTEMHGQITGRNALDKIVIIR